MVHTLETVVCDVARMVEMHMGSDGKFVSRIVFVRMFVMGKGYDMMVAMVAHRVVDHLYVEMCIVGNHIVHTLETVVCDVARMVEMRMGSD
ncbi:hypothetical protein Tco_1479821, partial [Tanacetum coccineum]